MKKISLVLYSLLILTTLSPVYALEANDIKCNKINNTTYYSFTKEHDNYSDAENDITEFEKYVLKEKGIVTYKNIKTNESTNTFKLVNGTLYADDEEALNEKRNEIENNYKDTDNTKYEIVYGDVVTTKNIQTSTEEDEGTIGKFYSEEDANKAKEYAEANNNEDFTLTCTIKKDEEFYETKVADIEKTFDTEEEAISAVNELKNQGYDITNIKINGFTVTINGEDETLENEDISVLQSHVASLESEGWTVTYNYTTREDVTGQTTTNINQSFDSFAKAKNYADNLNNTFDYVDVEILDESYTTQNTTSINETFDTEEEAENKATEYENQGYTVTNKTITENQTLINKDTKEITDEIYMSEEAANARISELENQGWTTVSKSIEKMTSEEISTTNVIEQIIDENHTLDNGTYTYGHFDISSTNSVSVRNEDGTYTTVTGNITLSSVALNGNTVSMASQATTDPGRQTLEFMSTNRHMSFGNNSVAAITGTLTYTVNGQTYSLDINVDTILNEGYNICKGYWGHSGNSGGTRGFDLEFSEIKVQDGKVIVDVSTVEAYKLNASLEKPNYKYTYTLTADITNETTTPKYTVKGTATNDIKTLINILNLSKTKDITKYKAEGTATMDVYVPIWLVDYKSTRTIYNIFYTYSQDYTVNQTDITKTYTAEGKGEYTESIVPKTGVNVINYEFIIIISGIILSIINVMYFVKNN